MWGCQTLPCRSLFIMIHVRGFHIIGARFRQRRPPHTIERRLMNKLDCQCLGQSCFCAPSKSPVRQHNDINVAPHSCGPQRAEKRPKGQLRNGKKKNTHIYIHVYNICIYIYVQGQPLAPAANARPQPLFLPWHVRRLWGPPGGSRHVGRPSFLGLASGARYRPGLPGSRRTRWTECQVGGNEHPRAGPRRPTKRGRVQRAAALAWLASGG